MRRIAPVLVATLLLIYGCSASRTTEPPVPAATQSQPAPTGTGTPAPAPAPPAEKPAAPPPQGAEANREKAVPVLPFRPTLLLTLRSSDIPFSKCTDVYGYDVATGQVGRLTEATPTCMSTAEIVVAGDGEWFGYARRTPHALEAERACVQNIRGGEPICAGKPGELAWPDGTRGLASRPRGLSPGGKWQAGGNERLTITDPSGQAAPRPIDVTAPFDTQWLDDTRLAVVQMENGRLGKLTLAGVDGKVTPVGRVPEGGDPGGMDVLRLGERDPLGRYLLVEYGYHAAVTRHVGTALYDTRNGAWVKLPGGSDTNPVGWVAKGKWLLIRSGRTYSLFDPATGSTSLLKGEIPGGFHSASPDGAWLLFFRQEANSSVRELFVYRIATGELRKVDVGIPLLDGVWVPGP